MERIQYLGYIVDEHGLHVDPTKIQAIHDSLASITLTELRSFLGLANFYCWFVLGFFHIAWPLILVTKGGAKAKFAWGVSQQRPFKDLKRQLCSARSLTLLDLQQPFKIETNAYDYAIDAILTLQGHQVALY